MEINIEDNFTLIAYNAKWDKDNKIDEIIDEYFEAHKRCETDNGKVVYKIAAHDCKE